uniref:condensation domain-containing protein n=1 Tax=Ruminococcus flavefaciens TaxID=1265 RepID=UPI00055B963C
HLAVDGVSWRILAEDFETAVSQIKAGKQVSLPEKTASFIEWSRKLKEYEKKLDVRTKDYWNKVNAVMSEGLITVDHSGDKPGYAIAGFTRETTEHLLTKSSNAYGARIDEVLIAALARAVGRITGQKKLAIKLEGHGREEIHEPISIDRTVGWFTNIYTVSVDVSEDNDTSIISAKDSLRGVPDNGMGYGFTEHKTTPDICFNYLGEFEEKGNKKSVLYPCGESIAIENRLPDNITVNGQVSDGILSFNIVSNDDRYDSSFIERLKNEFTACVSDIADYCVNCVMMDKTVSDLDVDNLEQSDIDFLNNLF